MLASLIADHPLILADCAVAEPLRRMPDVELHTRFPLEGCEPGSPSRLVGIQANGSSEDVTSLDESATTEADPVRSWAMTMAELHHQHQVPVLGGCCGTSLPHLEALSKIGDPTA